jgi:hypothetical protein
MYLIGLDMSCNGTATFIKIFYLMPYLTDVVATNITVDEQAVRQGIYKIR